MWRLFDWKCQNCDEEREETIEYPQGDQAPRVLRMVCSACRSIRDHDRLLSRGADYTPRPMAPMVSGGSFDTVGNKPLTPLPLLPNDCRLSDARDFFQTRTYKEVKEKRTAEKGENRMKQWRAGLIKKGDNIDMRTDKLPGDPSFTS